MIDALIIAIVIFAIYRGREVGFIRQAFSVIGFISGLFIGAWLQPHLITKSMDQNQRSVLALLSTLGAALVLMTVGEYIGIKIKQKTRPHKLNVYDNALGTILGVASVLFSIWLLAAVIGGLPFNRINNEIDKSRIVSVINDILPDAPSFISNVAHLIDPNGFPQVFVGREPVPPANINLPALGDLRPSVEQTRASVVKVEGEGCGGIVDGSGFLVSPGYVATNAHVVAGIKRPYVSDTGGAHRATLVYFDPNLDFAILKVSGLVGKPLNLSPSDMPAGTPGAVLGYPNGGGFNAGPAAILDKFVASGRNIYDQGDTRREIYEIKAKVVPGNSGGPLIAKDGTVMGVVFAKSTSHDGVGYALTSKQVTSSVVRAIGRTAVVSSGRCASE